MEALFETFIKLATGNIVRYFVIGGFAFGLFYYLLENYFQSWKIQVKKASTKDFIREILHSLQTTIIFATIGAIVLNEPVLSHTFIYKNIGDYPIWWIPVSLILSLLLHDTYFYWMHRLMHHKSLYKLTHLIHHKSTNPSPWTSYSFQALEAILEGMVLVVLAFVLPMHPITIGLFIFIGFLINVYGHLGYELFSNKFQNHPLFKILNTSVYHNMHHSHIGGNYSLYFRHWDKWMDTENVQYEKYFDKVTARKVAKPKKEEKAFSIKKAVAILVLFFASLTGQAQIEGKWKFEHRDAVVEIFQKDGKYLCKVIDAGNFIENNYIKSNDVFIFYNFSKMSNSEFKGGTIKDPYSDKQGTGTVQLITPNRIKISGTVDGTPESIYLKKL